MPMVRNGIQTPRGRQPEQVGIVIGDFWKPVGHSSGAPSNRRFCLLRTTARGHFGREYVHQVAHGNAGTDDYLRTVRTVKWVVLGKLRGLTLIRCKVKRSHHQFKLSYHHHIIPRSGARKRRSSSKTFSHILQIFQSFVLIKLIRIILELANYN